jgi:sulfite reductase alpha subunit-like flavoprotein
MLALAEAVSSKRISHEDEKSTVQDRARFNAQTFPMEVLPSRQRTNLATQYLQITLETNQRITSHDHWQDVRHMVFKGRTPLNYGPGDVLTIFPKNRAEDVDGLISSMQWTHVAHDIVRFVPARSLTEGNTEQTPPVPTPPASRQQDITFRTLLTDHLDLTAIPRRSFFSKIAQFSQDPMQRSRLLEFAQAEYLDELYDYTTRPRRSILEVLQEFDSVKIPWQWAANVLPELRGRQFSIASGGQLKYGSGEEARFELLVAIVKYQTVIKKTREGVCTRYLSSLAPGTELRVLWQKGSLGAVGKEARRPTVMVGPGTGVAPMRSLIWERLSLTQTESQTNGDDTRGTTYNLGESVLFFGCRSRDADFFFGEEWTELKRRMNLQVFVAFSRDQKEKVYVQDLITQQSELVFRLLHDEQGMIYVCGSSGKMPQGVRTSLIEVFRNSGNMDQKSAEEYLQEMEKEGRYKQETW